MKFLAPFADFDAAAWRQEMKDGGFTPAMAMKVYDEIRLFGHVSLRADPVAQRDIEWDEIRMRMCERLKNVKKPEDFEEYLIDNADLLIGKTAHSIVEKSALSSAWMRNGNWDRIDRGSLTSRLSALQYEGSEQWKSWDEMGMEWEDLEVAMKRDILSQPKLAKSEELTGAMDMLLKSMADAGLRGLEWGVVNGTNNEMVAHTAKNITNANAALCKRTGWKGGVLGINGKISFRLGLDLSGNSGTCCPLDNGQYHLNSSAHDCWGVVSHEWLHGLDFAMGHKPGRTYSDLASHSTEVNENTKPWKDLVSQMNNYKFGEALSGVVRDEINRGFRERWTRKGKHKWMPEMMDGFRKENELMPRTKELRDRQFKEFRAQFAKTNPEISDPSDIDYCVEQAMTELDLVAEQNRIIEEGGSIWVQFGKRFHENLKNHQPHLYEEGDNYFLLPSEQAAHSFEATFKNKNCFITDVDPKRSSLRYPLPSEIMAQNIIWKRMFKAVTPWWESQKPSFKPDELQIKESASPLMAAAKFKDRLVKSRGAKSATNPVPASDQSFGM